MKRDLYEVGIRVPMMIKWTGKFEPVTKTDLISVFWDVFASFSKIADIPVLENLDGISFLPTLLCNPIKQMQHYYLYWELHERGSRQAIRKVNWKAVKYKVPKNPNTPIELYDLSIDEGKKQRSQ